MGDGDGFKGSDHVNIQPGDANVPLTYRFRASTGSTANTGAVPYGSTLASSTIRAHLHDDTGVSASTTLVVARSLSSQKVTAFLSYSTTLVDGLYDLTVVATFSISGSTRIMTRQRDFDRVYVGQK